MVILGVHCGHNSSAALMRDGGIVGAVQEERFTKRKNQVAFPVQAIRQLIDVHLDGDVSRIERVAFATRDVDPIGLAVSRYSDFTVADHVREMHAYWRPVFYEGRPNDASYWIGMYRRGERLNRDHNVDVEALMALPLPDAIRRLSEVERPAVMKRTFGWEGAHEILDHHACHAHYAFCGAPIAPEHWPDTLVLTADSWGDGKNWSASTVDRDGTLTLEQAGAEHGVARIYRFVTLIMGMKPNEHEYKVMGLSGYVRSQAHVAATERVFYEALDFRDGEFVSERPLKDSYFDLKERLEGHRFDNIASALQNWATALTCAWAGHWLRKTGRRTLCFSGGLAMNIKANATLMTLPELDRLSIPASGSDESTSIGACYVLAERAGRNPVSMQHVYLGSKAPIEAEDSWREGLRRAEVCCEDYEIREGMGAKEIARLLAADNIVARVVGPMEFGARALGNRSILANPKHPINVKRINDAIKNRDFWMPFTPSILAERAERYLVIPKGIVSPYMTIGYQTTPQARSEIPAALHPGDFSARPQFVQRDVNPDYWQLISAFEELTGIGALLNTSLNLHGEPMNSTIADGARTLALSALEFLALPGDRLLYKKSAEPALHGALGI